MENSLAPAFVRINYKTAFGIHTMTLPSVPIITDVVAAPSNLQFDLRGAAVSVEVDDAVKDFVALIKTQWHNTTTFIDYTVFAQDDPEGSPLPLYSAPLAVVGTAGAGGIAKAVQQTWTFRADDFGLFKLVFLDVPVTDFELVTNIDAIAAKDAIRDYVTADVTWLASRSGGRPNVFLQIATTLNEKLRKAYRMV